jgi:chemotaxis response regulator CheB
MPDQNDDAQLAENIVVAIKAYDVADATRKEQAIIAGGLLAEAQKRHPSDKAFTKFLELAGSIGIRRAKVLIAIALGRKEFEQHQADNAAAQQRHREKVEKEKKAKLALPKPEPKSKLKPEPKSKPEPVHYSNASPELKPVPVLNGGSHALREFKFACGAYLPNLNEADLAEAQAFVASYVFKRKAA